MSQAEYVTDLVRNDGNPPFPIQALIVMFLIYVQTQFVTVRVAVEVPGGEPNRSMTAKLSDVSAQIDRVPPVTCGFQSNSEFSE